MTNTLIHSRLIFDPKDFLGYSSRLILQSRKQIYQCSNRTNKVPQLVPQFSGHGQKSKVTVGFASLLSSLQKSVSSGNLSGYLFNLFFLFQFSYLVDYDKSAKLVPHYIMLRCRRKSHLFNIITVSPAKLYAILTMILILMLESQED